MNLLMLNHATTNHVIFPNTITDLINNEIDKGITLPVTYSDSAAQFVKVVKDVKKISVCVNYKITVNKCTTIYSYPLPKIEYLYAKHSGVKIFTILDLRHA